MINEGIEGVSKTKFLMDANESSGVSSDYNKYGNNSQIPPSADADGNDNRDDRTIQRENFLNIY